jgi:hypothetical protein
VTIFSEEIFAFFHSVEKFSYSESKMEEMNRACSTNGEKRNACRVLVGKPEGKRPLRRPRRRWVDNIKMDHRETGWYELTENRDQWRALVNTVMNLRVP